MSLQAQHRAEHAFHGTALANPLQKGEVDTVILSGNGADGYRIDPECAEKIADQRPCK